LAYFEVTNIAEGIEWNIPEEMKGIDFFDFNPIVSVSESSRLDGGVPRGTDYETYVKNKHDLREFGGKLEGMVTQLKEMITNVQKIPVLTPHMMYYNLKEHLMIQEQELVVWCNFEEGRREGKQAGLDGHQEYQDALRVFEESKKTEFTQSKQVGSVELTENPKKKIYPSIILMVRQLRKIDEQIAMIKKCWNICNTVPEDGNDEAVQTRNSED